LAVPGPDAQANAVVASSIFVVGIRMDPIVGWETLA
jgi:hypothetical protein